MAEGKQSKTNKFFITFFIGLIVVSFMFTGYESFRGTPDTIAKVGGIPIKAAEYQKEYERQLQFYRQIFGGKDLTSEQIKNFNIKNQTLKNLAQSKLMAKLADDLNIAPAPTQIKEQIKELPYFKTNDRFDLEKYKAILRANRFSPADFEKDVADGLKLQRMQGLFSEFPLSQGYIKDLLTFKNQTMEADLVQVTREGLRKYLVVTPAEVKKYLATPANKKRVESLFNERKAQLNKPEQVKASHILLKTDDKNEKEVLKKIQDIAKKATAKNFKDLANKYTEDRSGKNTGGALNWFGRGRMVPEFDKTVFSMKKGTISKPIKTTFGYHLIYLEDKKAPEAAKIADHEMRLAREIMKKGMNKELDALYKDINNKVPALLAKKDFKELQKIRNKYSIQIAQKVKISRFDGVKNTIQLNDTEIKDTFDLAPNEIKTYPSAATTKYVMAHNKSAPVKAEELDKQIKKERESLKMALSKKLNESILKEMEDKYPLKIYNTSFLE